MTIKELYYFAINHSLLDEEVDVVAREYNEESSCEQWLYIEFDGNIESFDECLYFLSIYLEEAKQPEMELRCEYEAYIWD